MSKFFDRTQKAGETPLELEGDFELDLIQVHASVDEQIASVQPASAVLPHLPPLLVPGKHGAHTREATVAAVPSTSLSSAPPAVEFSFGRLRRFELPQLSDRLLMSIDAQLVAEAYRTLRTRLMRMHGGKTVRPVIFTSAVPGEGKTITAANLAICFAQMSRAKVLLVDGDLRKAGLTNLFGLPNSPGLTEVLRGTASYEAAVLETSIRNLYVVPAGISPQSSAELFTHPEWKRFIDWSKNTFTATLVDSPPILPLSDFEIMSAAFDSVLAVVRCRKTERAVLEHALTQIQRDKLLGIVFNGSENSHESRYYGSYGSYYGAHSSPMKDARPKNASEEAIASK